MKIVGFIFDVIQSMNVRNRNGSGNMIKFISPTLL